MGAPKGGLNPKLLLQGADERIEEIHHGGFAGQDQPPDLGIDDGAENDRALPRLFFRIIDMFEGILGLPHGVDEGQRNLVKLDIVELDQEAVTERLGGDRRPVGYEEHGAFHRHGLFTFPFCAFIVCKTRVV